MKILGPNRNYPNPPHRQGALGVCHEAAEGPLLIPPTSPFAQKNQRLSLRPAALQSRRRFPAASQPSRQSTAQGPPTNKTH